MPRITKVYTRTGDAGTTRLGGGQEVTKDCLRIDTYGTVDELNSAIGVALAAGLTPDLARELQRIQNELFHLGSDLCVLDDDKVRMPVPVIEARHVEALEACIDRLTEALGPLENFILPGGTVGAANLHLARTICRRAERLLAALCRTETVNPETLKYLNRLSDTLFVMARSENRARDVGDVLWDSRA
jgi:cob(I)alamin adenosyltransferase